MSSLNQGKLQQTFYICLINLISSYNLNNNLSTFDSQNSYVIRVNVRSQIAFLSKLIQHRSELPSGNLTSYLSGSTCIKPISIFTPILVTVSRYIQYITERFVCKVEDRILTLVLLLYIYAP